MAVEIRSLAETEADATWRGYAAEAEKRDCESAASCMVDKFNMPCDEDGARFVYVCGNSLGPQPKSVHAVVMRELEAWKRLAVDGHLHSPTGNNWVSMNDQLLPAMASLIGAKSEVEVALTASLTTNLHNLMVSFYRPTAKRCKIITDANSFPSDKYALVSQLELHGLKAEEALIEVGPRDASTNVIEEDDMVAAIEEHGHETALIMFAGVHYLTGQVFDMQRLAEAGRRAGCLVAFDLAHAIGNVPLRMHEWGADFAVWCTYKYLNSGPGAIGGMFVHERHHESISRLERPLLAGWWGVPLEKRFMMDAEFRPCKGARAFQQSCTPIFNSCGVEASMELFRQVHMETLRKRSWSLCRFFRDIIGSIHGLPFTIITPVAAERSAAQLSLAFAERSRMRETFDRLHSLGVITDCREPNIVRVTFCGLYNRFEDVFLTALALKTACAK